MDDKGLYREAERLFQSYVPHVKKAARRTKINALQVWRIFVRLVRKLYDAERRIEPRAIRAVYQVEEAIAQTAVKTAPHAKKLARRILKLIFIAWMAINIGILAMLIYAS